MSSSSNNKGLSSSRWAPQGPKQELVSTSEGSILDPTPVVLTVINPLAASERGLASSRWAPTPQKKLASTGAAGSRTVLDPTPVKVTVTNPLSSGDKGLAASRWASAPPVTAPKPSARRHPFPNGKSGRPKPAASNVAAQKVTVAASKPPTDTVLDGEVGKVTVLNLMPAGAKGLAASRWASKN
jgi:hypothetical protein